MRPSARFAYGLRVHGLAGVTELMPAGDDPWPEVEVQQDPDSPRPVPHPLDHRRGVRLLADGRHLVVDRERRAAVFHGPPLTPDLLAHPYLAPVASTFNRWAGRETFHAGGFVRYGRAWAVTGPRTAGKSSLLAALAARGVPVVADDVLVLAGTDVFAGPRCVDLREPVPGVALPSGPARARTRTRVHLPPIAHRTPLGGWYFLHWGDAVGLTPVPATTLLTRLAGWRSWPDLPTDPSVLLALAALPAWDLTRPRDWGTLDQVCALLDATPATAGEMALR
ncbi:hypothetical protein KBX06_17670 [Micromonospora sp. C31]|uniref:hypothetical protein n=1 Tax=Micromonospora sp. C31 TaxID=2824876 RepID=UPI001B3751E7|nr:hypothetical protein [Micromonospora sp. C31]MBQ1074980.1 hypothetical protein [Micromonospora sp. C31]